MQLSPYLHSVQVILTGKREIFALAINGSDTREPTCMSISGADIHLERKSAGVVSIQRVRLEMCVLMPHCIEILVPLVSYTVSKNNI